MSNNNRFWLLLPLSFCVMMTNVLHAQEREYMAIIPTFHDRLNLSGSESLLRLQRQRFVVFVYHNAVAVYSEGDFVNMGSEGISQEFGLPSTGHCENSNDPGGRISTGILSAQVWVGGERIAPAFVYDGTEDWYTVRAHFEPGERRTIKAIFWAQTSLTNFDLLPGLDTVAIPTGDRGFMLDLHHAAVWNNVIQTIDVAIVLKGGMSFQHDGFSASPDTYDLQDSTLTWLMRDVEPSQSDNIVVTYSPAENWGSSPNTMAKLSAYIVKQAYDKLIDYVRQTTAE